MLSGIPREILQNASEVIIGAIAGQTRGLPGGILEVNPGGIL